MTSYIPIIHLLILQIFQSTILMAAPLKCLLGDSQLFNVFGKSYTPASSFDIYKRNQIELDPIVLDVFTIDQHGAQIITKDLAFSGFNDAIVDEFSVDFVANLTRIAFHTDISIKGSYKLMGSLFSKPVYGEGPFTALIKDFEVEMVMPFEVVKDENGREYIKLMRFYSWNDISGNGKIEFGGIYNGNKQLSDAMHSMIHKNFRVFTLRFGEPFFSKIFGHLFDIFNNYMQSLPLKDLSTC